MTELVKILREIEETRASLNKLVADKEGETKHPEVTTLSSRLDQLIVRYEHLKALETKGRN